MLTFDFRTKWKEREQGNMGNQHALEHQELILGKQKTDKKHTVVLWIHVQ